MTKEIMTVHKALAELKLIDARIEKAIDKGTFCLANRHSNEKVKGVTIDECKKNMISDYDSATDLIKRRTAIKRAVVLSNAKEEVEINGVKYTVAEAIEMKNHGMYFKEYLLARLENQYLTAQTEIEKQNNGLAKKAEDYVTGIYGNKEGKVNTDDFEKAKTDFLTSNTYELINPVKILEKISALEKEINEFKAEVDAELSKSNALTEIEIEY